MLQHLQQVRVRSRVTDLTTQQLEHGAGALSVHVLFVIPAAKFLLVFVADHLKEVNVSVQGLVLIFSEFLDHCKFIFFIGF